MGSIAYGAMGLEKQLDAADRLNGAELNCLFWCIFMLRAAGKPSSSAKKKLGFYNP